MNQYLDPAWVKTLLDLLATLFVFVLGLAMLAIVVVYVLDVTQTKQALRRNYPVVVHFRYAFERLGQFFRQYFFAMDREEMPFNRAQRSWVYRAAKNIETRWPLGPRVTCDRQAPCSSSTRLSPH